MLINQWMPMFRAIIFSLSILFFLIIKLVGFHFLNLALSVLSIIAIMISIPKTGLPAKLFTFFFLGSGTWLVLQKDINLYQYLLTYGEMMYLLSLFALLPLLALPIKIGRYEEAIEQLLDKKKKTPTQFYRMISSISFLLSSFLNLATLPIMYHSVKGSAKKVVKTNTDKFISSGIVHGYTISVTWTPLSGVVGVVLEITDVSWQMIFPILFLISFSALALNWAIFSISNYQADKRIEQHEDQEQTGPSNDHVEEIATGRYEVDAQNPTYKIMQIVFVIILLILSVIGLNHFLSLGIVVTATLIAGPFALLWGLLLKKGVAFLKETRLYIFKNIPSMAEQFAIFLSAGFFVKALHFSGYNHIVNEYFVAFNHFIGKGTFLILLPLITLSFSFIGMHPIAAITLLAESLDPSILGINPADMTVALIGGAVMTFMVGPFSGTMNMMSSIIKVSPFRIASWSIIPTIGYFLILTAILLLFNSTP